MEVPGAETACHIIYSIFGSKQNGADFDISEKLNGLDARIVLTLHDEIIIEARDAITDQMLAIVKESMEKAFKQIIPEVPFLVEPRVADSRKGCLAMIHTRMRDYIQH
jgi:hypothetical protein